MSTRAFAVGIEHYHSPHFKRVQYAEKDAKDFLDALQLAAEPGDEFHFVPSNAATKTALEYDLRHFFDSAEEGDEVLLFYAGHGVFAHGRNYLTCVDSRIDDAARTCLATEDLFEFVKASRSTQVVMFFDACHSGVEVADNMRDTLDHLSEGELKNFFRDADYRVGFASCRSDEKSYSSRLLENGIWTYFLVQALSGKAPEVLDEKNRIRSNSLQDYLSQNVPRRVKRENPAFASQHPQMFGRASSTFIVADIGKVIEAQKIAVSVTHLKDFTITGTEVHSVKSLSGWKRHFATPKDTESYSEAFFTRVAGPDLEANAERLFRQLKEKMGYGIDAIESHVDAPNASITTDDFVLDLNYSLVEGDPSEYEIRYDLHNVGDTRVFADDQFNKVLADMFDTLTVTLKERQDMRELIRRLEKDKRLKLSTPSNVAWCEVQIQNVGAKFVISPSEVKITFPNSGSPQELLQSFEETLNALPSSGLKTLMG